MHPLIRILIYKTLKYCQKQNLNIQSQRPVLNIIEVAVDAHADGSIAAVAVYLCPAGDARANLVLNHVAGDFFLKLLYEERSFRSWANKAHISFQYIEKLRQLV